MHGLVVRSPLPLPSGLAPPGREVDVVVQVVDRLPDRETGRVLAASGGGDDPPYVVRALDGGGVRVRLHPWAAADVDAGGREVLVQPLAAGDDELALLLTGHLTALLLEARGRCVLHAAAVADAHGGAVALCGASGAGKTTLGGALADADHPLVADDLLGVLDDGSAWPAGSGLSVRADAAGLQREQRRPPVADPGRPVAVRHLVLLDGGWVSPGSRLRRLGGAAALSRLLATARLPGWREPAAAVATTDAHIRLLQHVEVWETDEVGAAGPSPRTLVAGH